MPLGATVPEGMGFKDHISRAENIEKSIKLSASRLRLIFSLTLKRLQGKNMRRQFTRLRIARVYSLGDPRGQETLGNHLNR